MHKDCFRFTYNNTPMGRHLIAIREEISHFMSTRKTDSMNFPIGQGGTQRGKRLCHQTFKLRKSRQDPNHISLI